MIHFSGCGSISSGCKISSVTVSTTFTPKNFRGGHKALSEGYSMGVCATNVGVCATKLE